MCLVCINWTKFLVRVSRTSFLDGELGSSVMGFKVALKCLIAVVLDNVDVPYWTSKAEHIVAFAAIFSNICTAHAQKRLFMNFRCTFRHHRSILRPRFTITEQNFGDLATFSVDYCILYSDCSPYFHFRFVSPTDLESILHASTARRQLAPNLKLI